MQRGAPVSVSFRYLDCLDTVRNQLSTADRVRNAGEAMFRILCGETLRLSQTQAFDSGQVLSYARDLGFLELVRSGTIEIVMREGVENPLAAFHKAVLNDNLYFSTWPDIENPLYSGEEDEQQPFTVSRPDARKIIGEAMGTGLLPPGMPPSLHETWKALQALNAAYSDYKRRSPAPDNAAPSRLSLRTQLQAAHDKAGPYPHLLEPLQVMLRDVQGEQRSSYHRYIRRSLRAHSDVKGSLHSIVNMGYNRVISSSLGAHADLTTPYEDAKELIGAVETEAHADGQIEIAASNEHKLQGLSWNTLLELRAIQDDASLSLEDKTKQIRERSVLAAEEMTKAGGESLIFRVLPENLAVGVDAVVGTAVTLTFDHFLPGAGVIFAELTSALLSAYVVKPSRRVSHWLEQRASGKQERDLIALQLKALEKRREEHG